MLRQELRKNVLWTRDSIKKLRKAHERDFFMSEQQIYKWWWDQTRKRSRKAAAKANGDDSEVSDNDEMVVSFQDEFGGYSSRLRIKQGEGKAVDEDPNVEQNLCKLLGIDVEGLALKLAQGIDPWADQEDSEEDSEMIAIKSDKRRTTNVSSSFQADLKSGSPSTFSPFLSSESPAINSQGRRSRADSQMKVVTEHCGKYSHPVSSSPSPMAAR